MGEERMEDGVRSTGEGGEEARSCLSPQRLPGNKDKRRFEVREVLGGKSEGREGGEDLRGRLSLIFSRRKTGEVRK